MHFLARCSYDGADFSGFAKSPPHKSIQESFELSLHRLFGDISPVNQGIAGGSRTDKGVHALDQCITFHTPAGISPHNLKSILNHHLPLSIRVQKLCSVPENFNLHRSIESKAYIYLIYHTQDISPFLGRYVWHEARKFSEEQWNTVFKVIEGERDFKVFAKEPHRYESTVCNLTQIRALSLPEIPATVLYFKANRFLYNMIRRIIGFAFLILLRQVKVPSSFEELLADYGKWATQRAPANGLYLYRTYLLDELKQV
jgi:tRNA pseudouridine38-40 synthase